MTWYAAHIIQYVKLTNEIQNTYPVYENIVLINAETADDAFEEAERIGNEEYGEIPNEGLLWDDKPASHAFAGVRKVVECQDIVNVELQRGDTALIQGHGTEVTYVELEVDSKEALEQLVRGERVPVVYEK